MLFYLNGYAQVGHYINNVTDTVITEINAIDSIRFNTTSNDLLLIKNDGNTTTHVIANIENVTFNAIRTSKHTCTADSVHNSSIAYGTVVDFDGNLYKSVIISNQEWMAENLKVTHYRNGDVIPFISDNTSWQNLANGAYTWYNNDSLTHQCPYGKLYNWFAVADSRNICPFGWHVPTQDEWTTLSDNLGGSLSAGSKLKSTGIQYWNTSNNDATNNSGFSGLPGGHRLPIGAFGAIINNGYWWTASAADNINANYRLLGYNTSELLSSNSDKTHGFSVRCIKD
jgi:uncharacterized protein (TIGR02145 family)